MAGLSLFPSRVAIVDENGCMTPEFYRSLQIVFQRVGGYAGDGGNDLSAPLSMETASEMLVSQPAPLSVHLEGVIQHLPEPEIAEAVTQPLQPAQAWPVGSIFMATVATDPALMLGYGTWAAWGSGRFPVSYLDLDGDFGTVEATGGAKTKAISAHAGTAVADHASHIHAVTSSVSVNTPGSLSIATTAVTAGAGTFAPTTIGGTVLGAGTTPVPQGAPTLNNNTVNTGGPGVALSHSVTQPSAHTDLNVLPPFIVAYFWKRTA